MKIDGRIENYKIQMEPPPRVKNTEQQNNQKFDLQSSGDYKRGYNKGISDLIAMLIGEYSLDVLADNNDPELIKGFITGLGVSLKMN